MILQWIRDLFTKLFEKNNIKLIEEVNPITEEEKLESIETDNLVKGTEFKQEKSKNEKIIERLKNIGCEKDIFYKNDNFDYVDLKRFKRNLNLLTALHLDKFELSKVLCQCDEILDMDSEIIENTINELKDYLEDEDIIRQIIYMNPYILTYNYLELINGAKDVFNKYNVDIKKQKYILEENPNIITLGKECIERSLDIIKKMSTSHESFIENIVDNPIIIGIEDEKLILKNISE